MRSPCSTCFLHLYSFAYLHGRLWYFAIVHISNMDICRRSINSNKQFLKEAFAFFCRIYIFEEPGDN